MYALFSHGFVLLLLEATLVFQPLAHTLIEDQVVRFKMPDIYLRVAFLGNRF